jgi:hypothetical protein
MRKGLSGLLAFNLLLFPTQFLNASTIKAGAVCARLGQIQIVNGYKYTCIKAGKKFAWNKGVLIPATRPSPTPSVVPVAESDPCSKMGQQVKSGSVLLECRRFAGNRLQYIAITNNFSPIANPESPDSLNLCQLSDKRTVIPAELKNNIPLAIAYPPKPFPNFRNATETFKVVMVGVDFSDAPGKGSPSDIWKEDIAKASDWIDWYTNGKVKLDFVTYPEWLRAPKPSYSYDASNNGNRGPGECTEWWSYRTTNRR